MKDRDI